MFDLPLWNATEIVQLQNDQIFLKAGDTKRTITVDSSLSLFEIIATVETPVAYTDTENLWSILTAYRNACTISSAGGGGVAGAGLDSNIQKLGCTVDGNGDTTGFVFAQQVFDETTQLSTFLTLHVAVGTQVFNTYVPATHGVWQECAS